SRSVESMVIDVDLADAAVAQRQRANGQPQQFAAPSRPMSVATGSGRGSATSQGRTAVTRGPFSSGGGSGSGRGRMSHDSGYVSGQNSGSSSRAGY
ncbi:hypothetical protein HDU98_002892, partial [Podochytrium sp. JEL0797]